MEGRVDAPPTGRRWFAAFLGLMALWFAYLALFGPRDDPGGLPAPRLAGTGLGEPADYSWKLLDVEGRPVDFGRFRGRTVVLNLWATWCPPCRREMPALARLADDPKVRELGVAVVCVSTDESPEALRYFLAANPQPMTVLRATSIPGPFLADGIPATFVIDPDGKVVASEVGAARWDDPAVVRFLAGLQPPGRG